ncbi:hypothetical protein OJAV_G00038570 [Oryzias javanicus]|uniref:Uncharacterized protein n=1 Tax=Oryzias javanicus TaxID=123683 RepID=A0A3S2PF75_ORYJA|nr:hypothetical protein OJAV_G00038570 [Oryzias javanicus]
MRSCIVSADGWAAAGSLKSKQNVRLPLCLFLPQHHLSGVEDLCDQKRSSDLKQEGPEPPQIKDEEEDLSVNPNEEQTEKQETKLQKKDRNPQKLKRH